MPITYNGVTVDAVTYNGTEVDEVLYNGVSVFQKVADLPELKFTSLSDGSTISFGRTSGTWEINCYYCLDKVNWIAYTKGTVLTLDSGEYVYFKCTTNTLTSVSTADQAYRFTMTGSFRASGNVMSLINYGSLTSSCFAYMFFQCSSLTTCPELPATVLANSCYYYMFGNTGIVAPPVLPATVMKDSCYGHMFHSCKSLKSLPELPATTLAPYCYYNMFNTCSTLVGEVYLPSTETANYAYTNMFSNCYYITKAEVLTAALGTYQMKEMFKNCIKLESITVHFSAWVTNATTNWVSSVKSSGTFTCPSALATTRGTSNIPNNWTITNI